MITAKVFSVEAKTAEQAEVKLAEEFNAWTESSKIGAIVHIFEPVRKSYSYGDSNYNKTTVTLTVFYC